MTDEEKSIINELKRKALERFLSRDTGDKTT
jgi:hypothetical protein